MTGLRSVVGQRGFPVDPVPLGSSSKWPPSSGPGFKLDTYRTTFTRGPRPDRCPNVVGHFRGVRRVSPDGVNPVHFVGIRKNLRCNSWDCPFCGERKFRKMRLRAFRGGLMDHLQRPEGRNRYNQKFLTLTYPGRERREVTTPLDAYDEMSAAFTKLMKALQKSRGKVKYLRVVEPQRDGFPHFHVLLVGRAIAAREVREYIKRLWCDRYGMGFIKLNVITNNLVHGIRYITKYLSKAPKSIGPGRRIFAASRGALMPTPKKQWWQTRVYFGVADDEGVSEVEITDHFNLDGLPGPVVDALSPELKRRLGRESLLEAFQEFVNETMKGK